MFNESSNFAENHERGVDNDTASVCEMNQISVDSDRDSVDGDKDGAENDNDSITAGSTRLDNDTQMPTCATTDTANEASLAEKSEPHIHRASNALRVVHVTDFECASKNPSQG